MPCPQPEKHRHRSKAAALAALESLEAQKGIDLRLRPYRCGNHWHLGHKGAPPAAVALERALRAGRRATASARRRRKR